MEFITFFFTYLDLNSTSIEGKVSDGQRVKYKCDGNESILRFIVIIVYCDYFEKGVGIYFTPNLVLTVADVMFTEKIKKRNSAWIGTGIFHIPEPEMFKVVPVKASTVEMELNSIKVISIKTHPGYKYKNYINNIAVLKVSYYLKNVIVTVQNISKLDMIQL